MRPGASAEPLASIVMIAAEVSTSFSLPAATIRSATATTVSASRIGLERSPLSRRPMLRITSLFWVAELDDLSLAMMFFSGRKFAAKFVAVSIQMNEAGATALCACYGREEIQMQSRNYIFWEVDVQTDFML